MRNARAGSVRTARRAGTTLAATDGTLTLAHPVRLNEYSVGALEDVSVSAASVTGSDPYMVELSGTPNLSRIYRSDRFTDSGGRASAGDRGLS